MSERSLSDRVPRPASGAGEHPVPGLEAEIGPCPDGDLVVRAAKSRAASAEIVAWTVMAVSVVAGASEAAWGFWTIGTARDSIDSMAGSSWISAGAGLGAVGTTLGMALLVLAAISRTSAYQAEVLQHLDAIQLRRPQ